jgi:hypothetical protein
LLKGTGHSLIVAPFSIRLAKISPGPTDSYISSKPFARVLFIVLMMEAVRISETSVYSHEITRRYIQESCHLHTRRSENLKSQLKE